MPELTHKERLQPSLLDRLTDDEPDRQVESREQRVFSLTRLREAVLRDLAWLLNTTKLEAGTDLDAYPEVRHSVLNYGIPDLSGISLSGANLGKLERDLRQAIIDFEPRVLRESLSVRLEANESQMSHNAMTFLIEGELWAQPVPLRMYLKTEIDLDIGDVRVTDYTG
ncbi:MAG: type VI secretion system baseplate subunit TssE [Gammaproteobacteria bacterium]|nr:type VI secretion system baseplate subunit TssE [Gammaproteobacteria bacterium]